MAKKKQPQRMNDDQLALPGAHPPMGALQPMIMGNLPERLSDSVMMTLGQRAMELMRSGIAGGGMLARSGAETDAEISLKVVYFSLAGDVSGEMMWFDKASGRFVRSEDIPMDNREKAEWRQMAQAQAQGQLPAGRR
jgi:hypothetical protein